MKRSSQPGGCVTNALRDRLALAQHPDVIEFDGVTVPVFTLPCGVHGAAGS